VTVAKVIGPDFSLIDVGGVEYKQVKLTIEQRNKDACGGCYARLNERLCTYLAPYCYQGWVFERC